MLIAALCAEGASEIGNVAPDRPRLRAHRRAPARARRADPARRELTPGPAGSASGAVHTVPARDRTRSPAAPATSCPEEMRELRAITDAMRGVFDERRLRRGVHARARARGRPAHGRRRRRAGPPTACSTSTAQVLVLRSDMTIPIARVVATRYADVEPPLRLCYLAARLPRASGRSAARRASCCRPASSSSAPRRRRGRRRR